MAYEYAIERLKKFTDKTEQQITDFVSRRRISYFDLLRFYVVLYRFPSRHECRLIRADGVAGAFRVAIKISLTQKI